jgi:hypothetical protein
MKVADEAVLAVIDELRRSRVRVTGARVRRELAARHGARGGVKRIYRLLQAPPTPVQLERSELESRYQCQEAELSQLREALAAALQRANLAEYREVANQDRLSMEIYQLREQLRQQREAPPNDTDRVLKLFKELYAARERIAMLEAQLV